MANIAEEGFLGLLYLLLIGNAIINKKSSDKSCLYHKCFMEYFTIYLVINFYYSFHFDSFLHPFLHSFADFFCLFWFLVLKGGYVNCSKFNNRPEPKNFAGFFFKLKVRQNCFISLIFRHKPTVELDSLFLSFNHISFLYFYNDKD